MKNSSILLIELNKTICKDTRIMIVSIWFNLNRLERNQSKTKWIDYNQRRMNEKLFHEKINYL